MSIMPRTVDVHLPNTKQKLIKQNTNSSKFFKNKERKSIQSAIDALDVENPFEVDYSLDNFKDRVDFLRNYILPIVEKLKTSRMGYTAVLKTIDLIEMFHEKDYKGELEQYDIKNSFSNRDPSLSEEGKKLRKLVKKLVYAIRLIGGEASFNWIPLGIMSDIICLEAEDRGHQGTLVFCNWRTKWKKSTWKKVIKTLEEEYDNYNDEIKSIVEEIKKLSLSYEKFSIEEVVPKDIQKYWLNYQHNIELKVYSNRDQHDEEILGINRLEFGWQVHQMAMKAVEKYYRERTGRVDNNKTYEIYKLVKDNPLFLGEKLMFASHAEVSGKMEMPEEEILWKFVSSRSFRKGKGASLDRYRGFDCTDENTRYKQYEKAVKHNTMKEWKKAVQAIESVAACDPVIQTYIDKIKKTAKPYKDRKKSTTNIEALSPKKVDIGLMYVEMVLTWITDAGHKSTENIIKSAAIEMFQIATKMLDRKDLVENVATAGTGARGRYEEFLTVLRDELNDVDPKKIVDSKAQLISNAIEYHTKTPNGLSTTSEITIIDRDKNAKNNFHLETICIGTGKNLDDGHKKPGDENGGHFLQFKGDNRFWKDKRTFVPKEYADEYIGEVKEFILKADIDTMENDEWDTAYINTKKFVGLWKENKIKISFDTKG